MTGTEAAPRPDEAPPDDGRRRRLWVNWVLALLTIGGAVLVIIVALGAVMSTAACGSGGCPPDFGPSQQVFSALYYGAPVISAVTILVSFVTAGRRWGFLVPLGGWALLAADALALVIAFRH